jgi:hypothetical protein
MAHWTFFESCRKRSLVPSLKILSSMENSVLSVWD